MASSTYMNARKKYQRPQAILLADNPGTVSDGKWIPNGDEFINFIILTDDNRQYIDLSYDRIEKRERMINGRMRSYHVADKAKLSVNWDSIPSRAYSDFPQIAPDGSLYNAASITKYTTDGGAGGADMKEWYDNNVGSFWVYLSYDDPNSIGTYDKMGVYYNEPIEMYFSNFAHTVQRRGGATHDLWNVQMSLEEV